MNDNNKNGLMMMIMYGAIIIEVIVKTKT